MINFIMNHRGNIPLMKPITKHAIQTLVLCNLVEGTDTELNIDVENVSLENIDNIASWVEELNGTIPLNIRVKDEYTLVIERSIS